MPCITGLDLSDNNATAAGFNFMFDSLRSNTTLRVLSLACNPTLAAAAAHSILSSGSYDTSSSHSLCLVHIPILMSAHQIRR